MRSSYSPSAGDPRRARFYVSVRSKFTIATVAAFIWLAISIWLAIPWIRDTARVLTIVPAIILVAFVALLPGALVAFLVTSLLLDRQPPLTVHHPSAHVTVLIAARNEAGAIGQTIEYLAAQDYGGRLEVVLIDNGSTDGTAAVALGQAGDCGLDLRVLTETTPGKSHALNAGLASVT